MKLEKGENFSIATQDGMYIYIAIKNFDTEEMTERYLKQRATRWIWIDTMRDFGSFLTQVARVAKRLKYKQLVVKIPTIITDISLEDYR